MKKKTETKKALPPALSAYLAGIGKRGGEKSRRVLTPEQAKAMVEAREKKRKAAMK